MQNISYATRRKEEQLVFRLQRHQIFNNSLAALNGLCICAFLPCMHLPCMLSRIVAPWIVAGQGKGQFPEALNQIGMHTDVV